MPNLLSSSEVKTGTDSKEYAWCAPSPITASGSSISLSNYLSISLVSLGLLERTTLPVMPLASGCWLKQSSVPFFTIRYRYRFKRWTSTTLALSQLNISGNDFSSCLMTALVEHCLMTLSITESVARSEFYLSSYEAINCVQQSEKATRLRKNLLSHSSYPNGSLIFSPLLPTR